MKPDFSGTWQANQYLVTIEHTEPTLVQHVVVQTPEGSERRQTFRCETGTEVVNSVNGIPVRTKARWEGSELVIESWMAALGHDMYYKDHWSLSESGAMLTMAHRDDDLAGQITVLQRVATPPGNSALPS